MFSFISVFPKDKNLIMFESFNGRQYSDSPRAIYEYIKNHHSTYKMVWSVDSRHIQQFKDQQIEYVKKFSLKWLLLMPRAKYWVTNSRFALWMRKSKDTVYLQTWHGTPLKKLGVDIDDVQMPGTNTEDYKKSFLYESGKWDYLISPNRYSTEIFKRAFGFKGKMIESGYPRNDFLINQNHEITIRKLKEKARLPMEKKIVLYAPTWRDDEFYDVGKYKFTVKLDLEQMKKELGDEYIVLLRMHYLVSENLDLSNFENFAYDFSQYEDIRGLYLISDILITDYSSVFFDFAILNKPIIFYVYDIEKYRDQLRGFYFDLEKNSPGPLLKTSKEVIDAIKEIEEKGFSYHENLEKFRQEFNYLEDGKATERVIKEVFNKS